MEFERDRKFAGAIYSTFGANLTPLTERYSKNLFAKQRPVASSTLIKNKIKAALVNFPSRAFETFVDFGHFSVFEPKAGHKCHFCVAHGHRTKKPKTRGESAGHFAPETEDHSDVPPSWPKRERKQFQKSCFRFL